MTIMFKVVQVNIFCNNFNYYLVILYSKQSVYLLIYSELFANFPPELQLELIEEDLNAQTGVTISPDEEQLEVLEDIWLKAGEIGMLQNFNATQFFTNE